jgi:hypothetical protein
MNGLTPIGCLNRMALQTFVLKGKGNATCGLSTGMVREYGIFKKCNGYGTLSQNGVSMLHIGIVSSTKVNLYMEWPILLTLGLITPLFYI